MPADAESREGVSVSSPLCSVTLRRLFSWLCALCSFREVHRHQKSREPSPSTSSQRWYCPNPASSWHTTQTMPTPEDTQFRETFPSLLELPFKLPAGCRDPQTPGGGVDQAMQKGARKPSQCPRSALLQAFHTPHHPALPCTHQHPAAISQTLDAKSAAAAAGCMERTPWHTHCRRSCSKHSGTWLGGHGGAGLMAGPGALPEVFSNLQDAMKHLLSPWQWRKSPSCALCQSKIKSIPYSHQQPPEHHWAPQSRRDKDTPGNVQWRLRGC